jgi:DNA-binding IclR family transcriptional regulator
VNRTPPLYHAPDPTPKAAVLAVLREYRTATTPEIVWLSGLTRSAAWRALERLRAAGVVRHARGRRVPAGCRRWRLAGAGKGVQACG